LSLIVTTRNITLNRIVKGHGWWSEAVGILDSNNSVTIFFTIILCCSICHHPSRYG